MRGSKVKILRKEFKRLHPQGYTKTEWRHFKKEHPKGK